MWEINKYHVKAFYLTEVRDYLEEDIPQIENIQAPGLDNDNEGEQENVTEQSAETPDGTEQAPSQDISAPASQTD